MAVNYADGVMIPSVVFYPIAAGLGAAHAGAGWLTIPFVPAGLAVGGGIIYIGRKLVYSITGFGMERVSSLPKGWIQQFVALPFFALYLILPVAIGWGGAFAVWAASNWLVRHIL